MRLLTRITWTEWAVVCGIGIVLLLLLQPPSTAVWSGRMRLSLTPMDAQEVDMNSVLVAYCWRETDLVDTVGPTTYNFGPLCWEGQTPFVILPTSGRSGTFKATYHHPKYFVVLYRRTPAVDQTNELKHRVFRIPDGRGDRSLAITLD